MQQCFFSPCPRGLEDILADEISALGGTGVEKVPGGVSFKGDWETCYKVNLESFIATRVLWRVGEGSYRGEQDIFNVAKEIKWFNYFKVNHTMRVYVTAIKSPLKSLNFITLKVKDAICDVFRERFDDRPSVDSESPDVRVFLFLTQDKFILYLDTSGEPLWKRGYKDAKFHATIKENLAAGIIRLSGWEPGVAFFDPMCGSGTLLLEALCMSLKKAPGSGRSFAFEKLKVFEKDLWLQVLSAAQKRVLSEPLSKIYGSDIDGRLIEVTKANLASAGDDGEWIDLKTQNFLDADRPEDSGVMAFNPPYGIRLGEKDELEDFYPLLGNHLKKTFANWNCYIFSGDMDLPKKIRLKASKRTPLMNGKIDCRLFEYKIISGSNR